MTNDVKAKKLAAVVPALHDALIQKLESSPRAEHYPLIAGMADQFMERFTALAPSELELIAGIDLEAKQAAEDQLDDWIARVVLPAHYMKIGLELPEWLQRRHKRTADYFAELFAGLATLPVEIRDFIDTQSPTFTLAHAEQAYATWQRVHEARLTKGENAQKIAEVVDLKVALIGLLRALGMQTSEITEVIYS